MRLDKFLTHTGSVTRSEAGKLLRKGAVCVDGVLWKDPSMHIDPERQVVTLNGVPLTYQRFYYFMLNKPAGYISATDDPKKQTVLDLLPVSCQRLGLFPCGRLDRDTVGLLLLTNDGDLAHRLLSPRHHVQKRYSFTCDRPLSLEDREALCKGVVLEDGYQTLPAQLSMEGPTCGIITVTEGKYHQIKRMWQARNNAITSLCRISFGGIELDPALVPGAYRPLTQSEIDCLQSHR